MRQNTQLILGKQKTETMFLLLFFILKSPWGLTMSNFTFMMVHLYMYNM